MGINFYLLQYSVGSYVEINWIEHQQGYQGDSCFTMYPTRRNLLYSTKKKYIMYFSFLFYWTGVIFLNAYFITGMDKREQCWKGKNKVL